MAKMRTKGRDQRVLVICVKFSDLPTTRLATGADWVALLNAQVRPFYERATYGVMTPLFEAPSGGPSDGWFPLGYPLADSNYVKTGQAAIDAVDPLVDFSNYNGVVVIHNYHEFDGQTRSYEWWRVTRGGEASRRDLDGGWTRIRQLGLTLTAEWRARYAGEPYDPAAAVVAHELGHQIGMRTHYGNFSWSPGLVRETITPWDVMGESPGQAHFLGWAKLVHGYLDSARVTTIGPPTNGDIELSVSLKPLERPTSAGVQLLKLPFHAGEPFAGYVIENRQPVTSDERVPETGVLLTRVNEHPDIPHGASAMVVVHGATGDLTRAALQVGETFSDPGRGIELSVVSAAAEDRRVRVRYAQPPAGSVELSITPWKAPPYWTSDIWVDSEKNGFGTYRYTDAAGNPVGQGDDPWVNHVNRIWVRIHNRGMLPATDVRVDVSISQPPGMGDAGGDWRSIGTISFPTVPAGSDVKQFVPWSPGVAAHTCIRAVIEGMPGEAAADNNVAQSNVLTFDTTTGSPWKAVAGTVQVYNPSQEEETTVVMGLQDVPSGWAFELEPPQITLPPGGKGTVRLTLHPSGPPDEAKGSGGYEPGFIGKPKLEALVPQGDTWVPIGGVEMWAHLAEETALVAEGTAYPQDGGVLVRGQLRPAPGGANVAVELRLDDQRILQHAVVDAAGDFRAWFVLPDADGFSFQASYAGDVYYAAAETPELPLAQN